MELIKTAKMNLNLIAGALEQGGATNCAEVPALVLCRRATDCDCLDREYRRRMEDRSRVFAAVEAVADANPVRLPREFNAHHPAKATAGDSACAHLA